MCAPLCKDEVIPSKWEMTNKGRMFELKTYAIVEELK